MTAHSPVGLHPERFGVQKEQTPPGTFANNDLVHTDPTGTDHDAFSYGLKKSLLNYMHGIGFDFPLQSWFEHKTPRTKVSKNYIAAILQHPEPVVVKPTAKIVWLGQAPVVTPSTKIRKGESKDMAILTFQSIKETFRIQVDAAQGAWLAAILPTLSARNAHVRTLQDVQTEYTSAGLEGFELFWYSKEMDVLREQGLLTL